MKLISRALTLALLTGAPACAPPPEEVPGTSPEAKVPDTSQPGPRAAEEVPGTSQAVKTAGGGGGVAGTGGNGGGEPDPAPVSDACAVAGTLHPTLLPYGDIWEADEGSSAPQPLPFAFNFLGAPQTQFWVTSNGELGFGAVSGGAPFGQVSCPLPDAQVAHPTVMAYATDFISSEICVATVGTAPRRKLLVTWKDARLYEFDGTGSGTSDVMVTAALEEGTQAVSVNVQKVQLASPFFPVEPVIAGAWATVGLQAGTRVQSFSCQQPLAAPGSLFRYAP